MCESGGIMRTEREAEADFKTITREGERLLAHCSCKPAEETINLGTSSVSYLFITNARLIYMSANNDSVLSVPWDCMTKIRLGRKRLKQTLGFSFRRSGFSGDLDYPSVYVSGPVAKAVGDLQSGIIPTYVLPKESTTAIKYFSPHEESALGDFLRSKGVPEYRLKCATCGQVAGFCTEEGDELSETCHGCERSFSTIVSE